MAVKILSVVQESTTIVEGSPVYNARAEIAVDNVSDLTTTLNDYVFTAGSIAWDISTGDFYGLNSSGTWVKQGTSEVEGD